MANSVDIITLGCSKNLVDTEQLMRLLETNGYTVNHDPEQSNARIVIINTCAFIGDAKEESIEMILNFARKRKQHKIDKLFVMGCLSQRYFDELKQEIPEVDKFYGKFDFRSIVSDLQVASTVSAIETENILPFERIITTPRHYAYLKISEGCNRTCSFCAIPLITGKYKSRSIEEIEQEVAWLVQQGVKEFQVIAQDLSFYGLDIYKKLSLADLLARISDIRGVEWLRLHYAYPANFPYDILPLMRERSNICAYLDIALQHISDKMLKLMRRNISSRETCQLLEKIRQEVPNIHLRTTLMVGHPQETQQDFEELKNFVKNMRFERMGAFAYSHEEGTYAYKHYQDDVPENVKQQRLNELMSIQEQISTEINAEKIGKTFRVIIDREDTGFYIGRTEFDSPEVDNEVLIEKKNKKLIVGNFYQVLITGAEAFDLYGEIGN